jgi:hypothetical protein
MKDYGLKLDLPSPEHYVFGGLGGVAMEVIHPSRDWRPFLPMKEYQNLQGVEPYACVSFSTLNAVEILIRKKYGEERNYSDRFLASISGTKEGGNTPQVVSEALRHRGVVKQEAWPFDSKTFEEFYRDIPEDVMSLAKDFTDEFEFKHDFVPPNHTAITSALECSPLLISVAAWFTNGEGRYYRPAGMTDNHATTLVYESPGEFMQVFDSYADGEDDPSLKEVVWEAVPIMAKRFWIEKRKKQETSEQSFWSFLKLLCKR